VLFDGRDNTAMGILSLRSNTMGDDNTAIGARTLEYGTGERNTAVGQTALRGAPGTNTGEDNTAVGQGALVVITTGDENAAVGKEALVANTMGSRNTAMGTEALDANETGSDNTALGTSTGYVTVSGSRNTFIGRLSGPAGAGSSIGPTVDDTILVANTGAGAIAGDIRIGNSTDHFNVYLPGITHIDILNFPTEFVHAPVSTGMPVFIPGGFSVALVPLIGIPLAVIPSITLPIGTPGDTLRLSFTDLTSPALVLVTTVIVMPPPVDPGSSLTTITQATQGTTWYFSAGSGGEWIRVG